MNYMTSKRVELKQTNFIQVPNYSAYGYTPYYLRDKNVVEILGMSPEELDQQLPIIRFNNDHFGYDKNKKKRPAGFAMVTVLHWRQDWRSKYPYVRIRNLAYGQVGEQSTQRIFLRLDEVLILLGLADKEFFKINLAARQGRTKSRPVLLNQKRNNPGAYEIYLHNNEELTDDGD